MLNHKPTPDNSEKEKQLQERLNEEVTVKLLRREVIAIFNILTSLSYKLGDAELVYHKLLPKLEPHAAVDTNIKTVNLGKKEEN